MMLKKVCGLAALRWRSGFPDRGEGMAGLLFVNVIGQLAGFCGAYEHGSFIHDLPSSFSVAVVFTHFHKLRFLRGLKNDANFLRAMVIRLRESDSSGEAASF
jgi:hypothetical protein